MSRNVEFSVKRPDSSEIGKTNNGMMRFMQYKIMKLVGYNKDLKKSREGSCQTVMVHLAPGDRNSASQVHSTDSGPSQRQETSLGDSVLDPLEHVHNGLAAKAVGGGLLDIGS